MKDTNDIVKTPVIELPTTTALHQMVSSGQSHASVCGVVVQNGIITPQTNNKAASGEMVPETPIVTTRSQYGLPEDAVVYCNFNQLYKVEPEIFRVWCNVSPCSRRWSQSMSGHFLVFGFLDIETSPE